MEEHEALDILVTIEAAYPYFMNGSNVELEDKVLTWERFLLKMDYESVKIKLDEHIGSNKFPPTISQINPSE